MRCIMPVASECRVGACRPYPSVSRRAARVVGDTILTTSDSRSCTGCPSSSVRTPPEILHPRPQHLGSPSPAGRLPRQVALECHKASPQTPAPPLAGWLVSLAGVPGPFAPPALPGFITTTDPSVSVSRFGTLVLAGASRLDFSLCIETPDSHVPRWSPPQSRATSIPDAVWAEIRSPPRLVPGQRNPPVSTSSIHFRHVISGSLSLVSLGHT
jgi:hypothetical protein